MSDKWFAVCETATGELKSVGTVIVDPLPKDLEAIALSDEPDWSLNIWDNAAKGLIPRPPDPPLKDRVDDIMAEPEFLLLGVATKDQYTAAIAKNLPGDLRYY